MTTSFTHKLVAVGILSISVFIAVQPVEARWIINRAGDVVLVRSQVLGVESTGLPELDDVLVDDQMIKSLSDDMLRDLDHMSQQVARDDAPQFSSGIPPSKWLKDVGPVPEKFRHIERKDITQIRITSSDDVTSPIPRSEDAAPVGGGPTQMDIPGIEPWRAIEPPKAPKPGVAIEVKTADDTLRIHQDELTVEQKGGNMVIGPSRDAQQLELRRNELSAQIPFPVKIDPVTQEIRVESPTGDLPLRIMPEQAKTILDIKSKLELVDGAKAVPEVVDGRLSYTYKGQQKRKLFGFIPFSLSKTVHVSAEDGTIVEEPQVGVWNRFKNWVSR